MRRRFPSSLLLIVREKRVSLLSLLHVDHELRFFLHQSQSEKEENEFRKGMNRPMKRKRIHIDLVERRYQSWASLLDRIKRFLSNYLLVKAIRQLSIWFNVDRPIVSRYLFRSNQQTKLIFNYTSCSTPFSVLKQKRQRVMTPKVVLLGNEHQAH